MRGVLSKRHTFILWLYRLRKLNPRYGLFQPDFISVMFGPYMLYHKLMRSNEDIKNAVNLWDQTKRRAIKKYGDIREWNTSNVTNMSKLFKNKQNFNDDISEWDVSAVTNMRYMFHGASSFNGDISGWDVSAVTDMSGMFRGASSFNGDISRWDVSSVTNEHCMLDGASSFNGDISGWDVKPKKRRRKTLYRRKRK